MTAYSPGDSAEAFCRGHMLTFLPFLDSADILSEEAKQHERPYMREAELRGVSDIAGLCLLHSAAARTSKDSMTQQLVTTFRFILSGADQCTGEGSSHEQKYQMLRTCIESLMHLNNSAVATMGVLPSGK